MIMSDITVENVKSYIRVDGDEEDILISSILSAAKEYVRSYTGQTDEYLDTKADVIVSVLALCADMYDIRQATVSNDKENPVVKQILGAYSTNLIG